MTIKKFKIKSIYLKGFTLIELLVVIALIGIIAAISFVAFNSVKKSARDGKRKADLELTKAALEMYRSDVGNYPGSLTFGSSLSYGGDEYMATVPEDPLSPTLTYFYQMASDSFVLCAHLELGSGTVSGCGSCGQQACNYKITSR